jgi:nucleoid-associated protein YgaU
MMSVLSAAEAGQGTDVSVEFRMPRPRAARSAPCGTAGPSAAGSAGSGRQDRSASEAGERDLRVTELHVRELHVRELRQAVRRDVLLRAAAPVSAAGPVRLTRRGRAVVVVLAILAATGVAMLLWLGMAAGAQASSHGQPARAGYQGMTQVVVRPGQTLWSIASAAEPSAGTWAVIQQIINANALAGDAIHAGQLLWVPRG